jgi:hypothetical protein
MDAGTVEPVFCWNGFGPLMLRQKSMALAKKLPPQTFVLLRVGIQMQKKYIALLP